MLRLTFLLCSGLFLAMLLGGRDFGQLRPGLARAAAEAEIAVATASAPTVETVALTGDIVVDAPVVRAPAVEAPVVVEAPVGVAQLAAPIAPAIVAQAVAAAPAPVEVAGGNTVFTLATFADAAPVTEIPTAPEATADGEIWYVAGNSLNVRAGPSTDDAVVGRLARGEAMLVVAREGDEWARIKIEGDGIEGYVATRFLTAQQPVVD